MSTHKRSKNNDRLVIVMPAKLKKWLQWQSFLHGVPICQIVIDSIENRKQHLDNTPPPKTNGAKANVSSSN